MAFKRIGAKSNRNADDVRIAHYYHTPPMIRVPLAIMEKAGIKVGSKIDIMADEDAKPVAVALVSGGSEHKMAKFPGTDKFCQVISTRLRNYVPQTRSVAARYSIRKIDGRKALVVYMPELAQEPHLKLVKAT